MTTLTPSEQHKPALHTAPPAEGPQPAPAAALLTLRCSSSCEWNEWPATSELEASAPAARAKRGLDCLMVTRLESVVTNGETRDGEIRGGGNPGNRTRRRHQSLFTTHSTHLQGKPRDPAALSKIRKATALVLQESCTMGTQSPGRCVACMSACRRRGTSCAARRGIRSGRLGSPELLGLTGFLVSPLGKLTASPV